MFSSSSGYIIEFNKETNFGYIETQTDDEIIKQRLKFHLYSLKKNARRYVTKENLTFIGELFDFDIIEHTDRNEYEAINIKHRILLCPNPECSRLKAFIQKKSLDEHIQNNRCQPKKIVEPKPQTKIESFVTGFTTRSAAVLGRFIGKKGVNLKEFQKENKVYLKILTRPKPFCFIRLPFIKIRVKPLEINVNIDNIRQKLKSLWKKAINEQQQEETKFKQVKLIRLKRRLSPKKEIDFVSDTRYYRAFTISDNDDDLIRRRRSTRYKQTKTIVRKQQSRFILNLQGHRYRATEDPQQKGTKSFSSHFKKKFSMKDKQWLIKEQLDD